MQEEVFGELIQSNWCKTEVDINDNASIRFKNKLTNFKSCLKHWWGIENEKECL